MMDIWKRLSGVMTLTVCLLFAAGMSASAQEAGSTETDEAAVPQYEREVFSYPALERRDPFRSLTNAETTGPRFEDLVLNGILYNPRFGSVAIVSEQNSSERHRLREGQSLGASRVVEIRADEVVFVVSGVGVERRETLTVKRTDKETDG